MYYEKSNMSSSEVILNDLKDMLHIYKDLSELMIDYDTNKTNYSINIDYKLGIFEDNELDNLNNQYNLIGEVPSKATLKENKPPNNVRKLIKKGNFKKINFIKKSKRNRKIGLIGEEIVLHYEKEYLKKHGKKSLVNRVRHISKEVGDGGGYDILSFSLEGKKKYIEVKTTTKNIYEPFYITKNEVAFSRSNSDNYYLYRIYDLSAETREAYFYRYNGDISKKYELEALEFRVTGIL